MLSEKQQAQVRERLAAIHHGDQSQLDVIFSPASRLLVEAPAGYGKTRTMVSVVANMIASGRVSNRKRILGLTFSVNAAFKIRRDVATQVPELLGIEPGEVGDPSRGRVHVSNYHGFCRGILRVYGGLLDQDLKSIDRLKGLDDGDARKMLTEEGIPEDVTYVLYQVDQAVKLADDSRLKDLRDSYLSLVCKQLLVRGAITFNAIILFVDYLFEAFPELRRFYTTLYPIVVVDEFQDTNILGWRLLKSLVTDTTTLVLMGDELQRIYGFIGAIPDLLALAEKTFSMTRVSLKQNHRFQGNTPMLLLDRAIRETARHPDGTAKVADPAEVPLAVFDTQEDEARWIADKVSALVGQKATVAVLVTWRDLNAKAILTALNSKGVDYFYGLFRDESPQYVSFHSEALSLFLKHLQTNHPLGALGSTCSDLKKKFAATGDQTQVSLLRLLELFVERVRTDYSHLRSEEKALLIREAFEGRALRQNMERLTDSVVVSTVHGAKGLEWDYVILCDMEKDGLPRWQFCRHCGSKSDCGYQYQSWNEKAYLEELSLFYVGATRARKQVFLSGSAFRESSNGPYRVNLSCFTRLAGLTLVKS